MHDRATTPTSPARDSAPPIHLNQDQLARRWLLSPRTLERWRWLKQGPAYLRVGGRVLYRLCDVLAFEAAHAQVTTETHDKGGSAQANDDA